MASDFGDESGEKLFDWLLRIGQDAGEKAMLDSADRLANAFRKAREGIEGDDATGAAKEWAKLDMKDFADLPEYETLKEIISEELGDRGIAHEFANEAGRDFLVFKAKDVHEIANVFRKLEESVVEQREKAKEAGAPERDTEHNREQHRTNRREENGRTDEKPVKEKPKGPNLNAPATEKQRGYIDSLKERNVIPDEELEKLSGDALTIGAANEILNRYGRFLKLDRDAEPLEERVAAARAAAKAMNAERAAEREIPLSQDRTK